MSVPYREEFPQVEERGRGEYDPAALARAKRKIDLHILPIIYVSYTVMRIDLNNAANVAIMNMEKGTNIKQQLHLDPQQWAWVLSSFYYTYMFLEPASTVAMKLTTPRVWISRIMVTWGTIMCCMAAVKSYGSLIACRALVGAAEAGFFPCVVYHWTFWFTTDELVPRIYGMYMANAMASFSSGFLSWAISFADGRLAGWQWLFIIEGLAPICLAPFVAWFLPNFPNTCKWLEPDEIHAIERHLHRDAPKAGDRAFSWAQTKLLFSDPTFWLFSATWCLQAVGGWGISTVLPTVIRDMGVADSAGSNLLQMPPAFSTIMFCATGILLTRKIKISAFPIALTLQIFIIIGYALMITIDVTGVRYFAACLVTASATTLYPVLWPKRVQAIKGTAAAGLGIGIHNALAIFNGILGPQLFKSTFGPRYITPFKVCEGLIAATIPIISCLWFLMEGDISRFPWLKKVIQSQSQSESKQLPSSSIPDNSTDTSATDDKEVAQDDPLERLERLDKKDVKDSPV